MKAADAIIWVGISFQQSASTQYFRSVRRWLAEAGRSGDCLQAVVNPSDEALWNLRTASSNLGAHAVTLFVTGRGPPRGNGRLSFQGHGSGGCKRERPPSCRV